MSAVRTIAASLVKVTAAAAAIAVAQPALGQTTGEQTAYFDPGYGATEATLEIPVTASVGGACGFQTAPEDTVDAGEIDVAGWTKQVPFTAQCTAPWHIAVSSQNGGLATSGAVETGYRNKAPYTVTLNVEHDAGTPGTVSASCPVAEIHAALATSNCDFAGTATKSHGLDIPRSYGLTGSYVEVSAPAYNGPGVLIAGTYTDTLTVTVSPAT